jgi:hypothetical protein
MKKPYIKPQSYKTNEINSGPIPLLAAAALGAAAAVGVKAATKAMSDDHRFYTIPSLTPVIAFNKG